MSLTVSFTQKFLQKCLKQWRQLRGEGGRRPPQASQNNINFIGFTDSMFNNW